MKCIGGCTGTINMGEDGTLWSLLDKAKISYKKRSRSRSRSPEPAKKASPKKTEPAKKATAQEHF